MDQEVAYLAALERATMFEFVDGRLHLRDDSGALQAEVHALTAERAREQAPWIVRIHELCCATRWVAAGNTGIRSLELGLS